MAYSSKLVDYRYNYMKVVKTFREKKTNFSLFNPYDAKITATYITPK